MPHSNVNVKTEQKCVFSFFCEAVQFLEILEKKMNITNTGASYFYFIF